MADAVNGQRLLLNCFLRVKVTIRVCQMRLYGLIMYFNSHQDKHLFYFLQQYAIYCRCVAAI